MKLTAEQWGLLKLIAENSNTTARDAIGNAIADIEDLGATIAGLRRQSRRFYHADGSWVELGSAEDVVERRIKAAAEAVALRQQLHDTRAEVTPLRLTIEVLRMALTMHGIADPTIEDNIAERIEG